ncbi:unnamed protein product [Larinioides sclopetarius]|uniref:Uncharacterized protein n=1 Tax=Larinioides sclopetarius TaxID=280406 RepID=A0AAV2BYD8_9ARAC
MTQTRVYTYTRNFEDNNLGHKASYKFRLFHLSTKISWPFIAEYNTNCSVLPTVFKLDMMFQKVPLTGFIDIPYSIERKDSLDRPVDAFFSIRISDANGQLIFQPLNSFGKSKMMTGETTKGNITGVITLPEMRYAFNEDIEASIELMVIFCHSGIVNPSVNANTNENITAGSDTVTYFC